MTISFLLNLHNFFYTTYCTTVTSDRDYEELRIELWIHGKMAVVITQEQGIDKARIEFWYPKDHDKWVLEYHVFLKILKTSLDELAQRTVDPVADPNEEEVFSVEVVQEPDLEHPIAKLHFKREYLGSISQKEGLDNAQLEIVACPYNKYWEFSYRGFTDLLRDGYQKLLKHSEI